MSVKKGRGGLSGDKRYRFSWKAELPGIIFRRAAIIAAALGVFAFLQCAGTPPCRAANPGDLFVEGCRYYNGQGVPRDLTRAARFFLDSAWGGEPQAQFLLGVMHMEGWGVPKNAFWAYYWLHMATPNTSLPDHMRKEAESRLWELQTRLTSSERRRLGMPSAP